MKLQDVKSFKLLESSDLDFAPSGVLKVKHLVVQVAFKIFSALRDLYFKIMNYIFNSDKTPLITCSVTCSNFPQEFVSENSDKDGDEDLNPAQVLASKLSTAEEESFQASKSAKKGRDDLSCIEGDLRGLGKDSSAKESSKNQNNSSAVTSLGNGLENPALHPDSSSSLISHTNDQESLQKKDLWFQDLSENVKQSLIFACWATRIKVANLADFLLINKDLCLPEGVNNQKDSKCNPTFQIKNKSYLKHKSLKIGFFVLLFLAGSASYVYKKRRDNLTKENETFEEPSDLRSPPEKTEPSASSLQTKSFREKVFAFLGFFFSKKPDLLPSFFDNDNLQKNKSFAQLKPFKDSSTPSVGDNLSFSTNDTNFSNSEEEIDALRRRLHSANDFENDSESEVSNLSFVEDKLNSPENNFLGNNESEKFHSGSGTNRSPSLTESVKISSFSGSNSTILPDLESPVLPAGLPPLHLRRFVKAYQDNSLNAQYLLDSSRSERSAERFESPSPDTRSVILEDERENTPEILSQTHPKHVVNDYRDNSSQIQDWLDSARGERPRKQFVNLDATPRDARDRPESILERMRKQRQELSVRISSRAEQLLRYAENSSQTATPRIGLSTPRTVLRPEEMPPSVDRTDTSSFRVADISNESPFSSIENALTQQSEKYLSSQPRQKQVLEDSFQGRVVSNVNKLLMIKDPELRDYVKRQAPSRYGRIVKDGEFFLTTENTAKARADLDYLKNERYRKHLERIQQFSPLTVKENSTVYVKVTDVDAIKILKASPQSRYSHRILGDGSFEVPKNKLPALQRKALIK